MTKKIGDFEVEVWTGGAPIWVHIRHRGHFGEAEFKFRAEDLPDLEYAVKCAQRLSNNGPAEQT